MMAKEPTLRDILDHDPKPLRFGTSGVRAKVEDLTDIEVYCLTRGTLAYFEASGKLTCGARSGGKVAIPVAGDLRPSTERLLRATAKAIVDAGHEFDYCGRIPTPALTYYALQQGVASFVVTGSHIPADRNGQKANRCDGEVLKSDEQGIVAAVEQFRQQEYARPANESPFAADGSFKAGVAPSLPPPNSAAADAYRERYRQLFGEGSLEGWRVLFFEYSAVGRDLIPRILADSGAEVVSSGRSDQFIPLDTEAISDEHLRMLGDLASAQHQRMDVVLSTDGDSDRPLVVGLDGDDLHFIPGDLLGALVADYLQADAVAVPISANPALEEFLRHHGISVMRTRIGSPFVIDAMTRLRAQGYRRVMAWEANGGVLLGMDIEWQGKRLGALPTRDALLPMMCVLAAARQHGGSVAELLELFPPCYGKSDLIDDFPQQMGRRIVASFTPSDAAIKELRFEASGIVLGDENGAETGRIPWQSDEGKRWQARLDLLARIFTQDEGFSRIERINVLDGVRCYFANGEIAHIRPSGNAPQLRIYAFADMRDRAREIAEMAVREPDGLLRRLASAVTELDEA